MNSAVEYQTVDAQYLAASDNGWWYNEEEFMETVPLKKPLKTELLNNVDESCNQEKVVGFNVFNNYKMIKSEDVAETKNKSCTTDLHQFPF